MVNCPVCGREIASTDSSPDKGYGGEEFAPAQTVHGDERYRFCSTEHKDEFEAYPGEYVSDA